MLQPSKEGTTIVIAKHDKEVRRLLQSGITISDTVIPRTAPKKVLQLSLFGE
jgi:hypothetical protein